jgi:hypothetical protein
MPAYVDSAARNFKTVPGTFSLPDFGVLDVGVATGTISISPSKYFNLTFGQDKHFIGDGYRSLMLSDNAAPYPFLKFTTDVGPIKYTNLYMQMYDNRTPPLSRGLGKRKKFSAMHYIDINLSKRVSLGLYQATVWEGTDSNGNYRGYDLAYLNPIIFLPPTEFSMGSPDNGMVGSNLKVKISNSTSLYGQLVFDELRFSEFFAQKGWFGNKYSIQLGAKSFNSFGVKNLYLQGEFNMVRPYMYSHWGPATNWQHNGQALAHPLGANFYESIAIAHYKYKRWYAQAKVNFAILGNDSNANTNIGRDIDKDYQQGYTVYGNTIAQGVRCNLTIVDLRMGYCLNTKTNLRLELSYVRRSLVSDLYKQDEGFWMFTIATMLRNTYWDF